MYLYGNLNINSLFGKDNICQVWDPHEGPQGNSEGSLHVEQKEAHFCVILLFCDRISGKHKIACPNYQILKQNK